MANRQDNRHERMKPLSNRKHRRSGSAETFAASPVNHRRLQKMETRRRSAGRPGGKLQNPRNNTLRRRSDKRKVTLVDFNILTLIGKGGYGEVYLVEHKERPGRKLALKMMHKDLIKQSQKIQHIKNERDVLIKGNNPHLVKLHYSFQDKHSLFLAMEYCPGGDLKALLLALGSLEEEEAQLYFAEMLMAVDSLHKMGYLHRDIKPENFLIDRRGHLKLTDFGLCKSLDSLNENTEFRPERAKLPRNYSRRSLLPNKGPSLRVLTSNNFNKHFRRTTVISRTTERRDKSALQPLNLADNTHIRQARRDKFRAYSIVGSPNYMSPEVVDGSRGYSVEVDWWSLGCCFFETVMGMPPFAGDTPEEVFKNIRQWKSVIPSVLSHYKLYMTPSCYEIISGLLADPDARLGKDVNNLKKHPFFKGLDWNNLFEHTPPFVPNLEGDTDTSYFEDRVERIDTEAAMTSIKNKQAEAAKELEHKKSSPARRIRVTNGETSSPRRGGSARRSPVASSPSSPMTTNKRRARQRNPGIPAPTRVLSPNKLDDKLLDDVNNVIKEIRSNYGRNGSPRSPH
mmetsp:Transcript_1011/g.1151  ORF Transcript_1011/g.1151 Transcript_1011/m.1151 type:complete len:568 (+) Transcript_1011:246-1949(+)